jgi:hypothetical protein
VRNITTEGPQNTQLEMLVTGLLPKLALCAAGLMMGSCSSPKLPNTGTAAEQFAALSGNGQRGVAKNFYELGQSDAVKRLYWAQRRAQETGDPPPQHTSLQRKYVVLPVPEHTAPDGTLIEANQQVVEVVQ